MTLRRLNQNSLDLAMRLWGLEGEELQFVRKVANYVYYAPKAKLYFRFTEEWHRSEEQLNAELDWMFFLKSKGVNFAHPILSKDKNYFEKVEDEGELLFISVMEEAPGKKIQEANQLTPKLLKNWGALIGRMHQATMTYTPGSDVAKRASWDTEEYHLGMLESLSPKHGKMWDEYHRIEKKFNQLPRDNDCFGLIHADLHTGNFHVDEKGELTAFDFDDALYHWFVFDLMIVFWCLEQYKPDWKMVSENLFEGYQRHHKLDQFWLKQIPDFYLYRYINVYFYANKLLEDKERDEKSRKSIQSLVDKTERLFDGEVFVPFDEFLDI